MFRSGNFYVEFQEGNDRAVQALAAQNGRRIYIQDLAYQKKFPFNALYQDGKYYNLNFTTKISSNIIIGQYLKSSARMLVLPEEQINSPNLDPNENWGYVRKYLHLPTELAIFYWEGSGAAIYNGSSTIEINKKIYDCDQYIKNAKNMAGETIAQEIFNALYENGKLVMVQRYFQRDDQQFEARIFKVKTITSQVPESIFEVKKKFKLYKAHNGDMDDLLGNYQEIGEIGGKKK